MNKLYETENFNITIYANSTLIQTLEVMNLTSYIKASLTVYWNTSNVTLGNYTLHVQTDILLGKIEINDNIYTGCNIEVIMFDVNFNDDGVVNALDLRIAAIYFGQMEGRLYNLNFDNTINLDDLQIITENFGKVE